MQKDFDCPSCNAPMKFAGGESIFQTCEACNAPIVIPSDIFHPKDGKILSENFASLTNDIAVDPEQVTNELTPGNKPPLEKELIDQEAKIEKFEVYQEKIGTSAVSVKEAIDEMVNPVDPDALLELEEPAIKTPAVKDPTQALDQVKVLLGAGKRVAAVKMFRDEFATDLEEAYEAIKRLENDNFIDGE